MALGGGTFTVQNRELPGTYINFVSASSASASLSDRGTATMPLELDWGRENGIFEVTNADFQKNSLKIFGYDYAHEKMKGIRDLFLNARMLYAYRLNGGGKKAENDLAEALYSGIRGNDLKIAVQVNADDENLFDVKTILGTMTVDEQTVSGSGDLKDNDFLTWKSSAVLYVTASLPLEGGENGTVDGAAHQAYLDRIEPFAYNTMGVAVTDETIKSLYVAFNRRLRDEMGIKFQLVLHRKAADYHGVISVGNDTADSGWNPAGLVHWVTGAEAGCAVSGSLRNRKYNGEFTVNTDFTQNELKKAIGSGTFLFHRAGADIRVLEDINTTVTVSDTLGDVFKDNQTIRVTDQIGNDIAVLFNTQYLGVVPNDAAGRISLWSDIVAYHRQLEQIRAIENFSETDVVVDRGNTKKSVTVSNAVTVVNSMGTLYMTVTVA